MAMPLKLSDMDDSNYFANHPDTPLMVLHRLSQHKDGADTNDAE